MALCAPGAQAAEPATGVRSLAMGNSLRGIATGAEGLLLNPSGIELTNQYAISLFYSFDIQSLGHVAHVSIADSVTQRRIGMGLFYNFIRATPHLALRIPEAGGRVIELPDQQVTRNAHEVGLVTAFPLGDMFTLGVTTKYGYFSYNTQLDREQVNKQLGKDYTLTNPSIDKDLVYDLNSIGNVVTFDLGLSMRISRFSLGIVGQNLWPHGYEQPAILAFGLGYMPSGRWTLAADTVINFTGHQLCTGAEPNPCDRVENRVTVRAGGGIEYLIADRVPVRAGYLYDSANEGHHVSAGLGYTGARYAIDFSMRQRVTAGLETILLLGFRVLDQRRDW